MSLHADPPPRIVREPHGVQYITADQLGKGGFAICYRAEQCNFTEPSGKLVALKIVRSQMEPQKLAQKFVTELQLHSKLRHPNIVEFYRAFSFEKSTYVVLEICDNGSLADAIKKRKFFTMPEIRRILIQTCGAVKYLHHRNIVHRDLKTGNIFLDENMNVKVGDFGLAAVLVGKNDIGLRRTTMCGTPNYLAPEILEKTGKGHNEKVDLWAIGIIAYTLAVGKAPFHAAKREEIYKKLQNREYEWPDLSKHQNDISNDLRDLVSSLLVDEDDRPGPDKIVSHTFFKLYFIPEHLDSSCTSIKPTWPHNRPPSAETMRRGYTDNWFKLCKASGVGEYAPSRLFNVVGLVNSSVVKDVEREIKAGKAPTVPIAPGTVYLPFVSERKDKTQAVSTNLSEIAEESSAASSAASSANGSQLAEISANDRVVKPVRAIKAMPSKRLKENVPPNSTLAERQEETNRPQRPDTTLRRARSTKTRLEEAKKTTPPVITSKRTQRITSNSSKPVQQIPSPVEPEVDVENPIKAKVQRSNSRLRTASQEENPNMETNKKPIRPVRSRTASREDGHEVETLAKPIRMAVRSRVTSREERPEVEVPPVKAQSSLLTERPIRPNASRMPTHNRSEDNALQRKTNQKISLPNDTERVRPEEQHPAVLESLPNSPDTSVQSLHNTDPSTVLAMATKLRGNLLAALTNKNSLIKGKEKPQMLPFVTKWVDYAKKHGIGYILSDGTVGCVFNGTTSQPVRHVLVRDGSFHLSKASGDKTINMNEIPLEFYSVGSTEAIKPMIMEAELRRQNGLLWAKFARYMCSSLSGTSERANTEDEGETDVVMARYYQRLGNVGVWGFSNGCFQVNFPDHTKLVISADGKYVSFTCLPTDGISHLERTGDLPLRFVRSRQVIFGSPSYLLHGTSTDAAVTQANMFTAKLQFLYNLVSLWVAGGGLGCRPENKQWPKWTGPQLEDAGGRKVDWITVGRFGQEAVVVERAPRD